ncbi:Xaa-Pro aminopeptidase [Pacificimonas flava]|uniref:Xaa-Pro aminopeptidase n=2 Tax=Pacificimonas TaxID=1960290 RepID=A0A219B7W1_9SPHN|nr:MULTISPECIES: M24 family metallopeptidase [Pacificimonas]MBZ6379942.1 aminopeptidase P family protein [Pacificimonas aurantium]OWV34465.1 Xaa-Pro aminopeptidase [Pacificimonas flava]
MAGSHRLSCVQKPFGGALSAVSALLLLSAAQPGHAQSPAEEYVSNLRAEEVASPEIPDIMPLRKRAKIRDAWLAERLDSVVPELMRENGVDMWVLIAREYLEDPVVSTMLNATSMRARRRTILVIHDPGEGQPLERLTVSRYGLGGLFEPAWDPESQPDQWQALADLIEERDPEKIAINTSPLTAFGDGLTLSQFNGMMEALPERYRSRTVSGENLAVGWLETRIPAEMELYPHVVRTAHAILAQGLSRDVITPGVTTTADVQWWYREKIAELKLQTWFHPSVHAIREGEEEELSGDAVIQPGDLIWTDFGIVYLGLNTDTQHLAYVLKPGETEAPQGLQDGLAAANAVQDVLTAAFESGLSGNQILEIAREEAISKGLTPSIYSHPIGFHGHGAGTTIGFWDNQGPSEKGDYLLRPNVAFSIELNAVHPVPEWGGQEVTFKTEEDAFFDGEEVHYIDGRQTALRLIPSD